MDRIILIGVNQGVMIGGRFDGWLAQLTEAGWVTIRKLEEADPYEALPDVLRSNQSLELGVAGPATGPRQDRALHDAETRRRRFMANFPVINAEAFLSAPSALENGPAGLADAPSKAPDPDLSSLRKGAEVVGEIVMFEGVGKEVSWRNGKMPPVGTKLCAHPPLTKGEDE